MGNQIKNQEVAVESGTKMNDKDYMNSLLGTLYEEYKQAFEVFSHLQR